MQQLLFLNIRPILGVFTLLFICHCFKDPEGYEFRMKNPDELKPDTDSIEVYIVYELDGEKKEHMLYAGRKGDDGFEGPYEGVIENYIGGDFRLHIVQFNDMGAVINEVSTKYDEKAKNGETHVVFDWDLNVEKIKSVKILKDSTKTFGAYSRYYYKKLKHMQADSIRVYNGEVGELEGRKPSAVIIYDYNEHGVEGVKVKIATGVDVDSNFAYDDKDRLQKIQIISEDNKESLKFKYNGSDKEPYSTSHYNAEGEMDRLIKHVYNKEGRIKDDSIFAVDSAGQTFKRLLKFEYKDDSIKIAEKIFQQRKELELFYSYKFIYDDTTGFLVRKEKWEEGGKPFLSELFEYRNSRLGNPETAVQIDEDSGELINYFIFKYDTIPYENVLSKLTAAKTAASRDIISRIPDWCLEDFECR